MTSRLGVWNSQASGSGLTRRRSWRGPTSVRRPSRLCQRQRDGVTPPASRASHAGRRRAASASGRGPWPRSLAPSPLGGREKEAASAATIDIGQGPSDRVQYDSPPRDGLVVAAEAKTGRGSPRHRSRCGVLSAFSKSFTVCRERWLNLVHWSREESFGTSRAPRGSAPATGWGHLG